MDTLQLVVIHGLICGMVETEQKLPLDLDIRGGIMQVYILIGCVLFAWFLSGLMADNYALRRHFKQQQKLSKIDLDRYNFVVGMLNQEQQKDLHEYYVLTGAIKEE